MEVTAGLESQRTQQETQILLAGGQVIRIFFSGERPRAGKKDCCKASKSFVHKPRAAGCRLRPKKKKKKRKNENDNKWSTCICF